MNTRQLTVLVSLCGALAACGDSPSSAEVPPPPPPVQPSNEVPTSATASSSAYVQYSGTLAASDTAEPLLVDKVTPPTSETEDPLPV
jgi:hypothetical protein